MPTINPKHKAFADEYLNNGRNATQAYLAVYKPKNKKAARISANRLLTSANVCAYIANIDTKQVEKREISKQKYLDFLDSVVDKVNDKDVLYGFNRRNALDAIKIIGKWQGYESPTQVSLIGIKDILKTQEDEEEIEL